MLRAMLAMLRDESANALVEYAIVAAGIALPLIGIGYAIAQHSGSSLSTMTGNMSNLGISPP